MTFLHKNSLDKMGKVKIILLGWVIWGGGGGGGGGDWQGTVNDIRLLCLFPFSS